MWSRSGCDLAKLWHNERHVQRLRPTAARPVMRGTRCPFWYLPSFAFALGFFVSPGLKTVLWTLSLGLMGTICLLNASRCGRIHCYFTGPFFILAAVTSLGYGTGLYVWSVRLEMDW